MDWKILISELQRFGLTQAEIARLCGGSQSTISELAKGITGDPRYGLGARLIALRANYPAELPPAPDGAAPPKPQQMSLLGRGPARPREARHAAA